MSLFLKYFCRLISGLAVTSALWAGQEFPARPGEAVVPNQLLVRYKAGTPQASIPATLVRGGQAEALAGGLPDVYLVRLPPGADPSFSTQLSQHPLVEYVEPNRIRHTTVQAPNDPNYAANQYALQNIQALPAWRLLPNVYLTAATAGTNRIKVAVLDTGADCTHPDFMNAGGGSDDAASGGQILFSLSHAYVTTTITPATCPWQDDYGHGTHVSGTIAAATNNSVGVSALGYPLELIEYKVLDATGSGSDSDVASAITAAADAGASVISMSLGADGYSQTLQDAINHAWQKNCVVIAAAGNSNVGTLFFPAGANYTIGVAATDSSDAKASFSNFGPDVDIAAPGVNVLSTMPTYHVTLNNPPPSGASSLQNYDQLSGTSMATPHVAGLAGLIEMTTPNLAAMAVAQRIQQSADKPSGSVAPSGGWDQNYGYGRINAWRAVSTNLRTASVGGFVGQVLDSGTGLPIKSVTVSVPGQSVVTDSGPGPSGLFRLSNLNAGTYTITASAANRPLVNVKAAVVAGADTTVTITMGGTLGEFHGVVTDGGVPVAGAVVQVVSSGLVKGTAVTDSTGAYSILAAAGTYDLLASTVYGVTTTVASQNLTSAGLTVNISMALMGSIAGTILDASNNPIANTQIALSAIGFSAGAITDGSGHFSTIGLPAGTYTVSTASGLTGSGVAVTNDHVTLLNSARVTTNPPGLSIVVDGVTYTAPQSFLWTNGSAHSVSVSSPQNGPAGTRYVWSNWSDFGAISHNVTAGSVPAMFTANFSTQFLLTLAAAPGGGGTLAASPSSGDGFYASGTSVQVTANANAGYQFTNFSGDLTGSTNPQSVAMSAARSVTGNFNAGTTVSTNPAGLSIIVDGTGYTAPQTFNWTSGSGHTVAVTSPQAGAAGTRYVWSNWSDGGAVSHNVTAGATPTAFTANFTTQFLLILAASPSGGGTLATNPASGDGYYASGTSVQVTATANAGYQFANFSGDLTGSTNSQSLIMNAPRSVTENVTPLSGLNSVLTWHNDNARTGQNLQETALTLANVNASMFGKLFVLAVDGKVDAQPLYVPSLTIPGKGVHNVLYVMTEHGSAYAFDADNGAPLLQVSLLGANEVSSDDRGCSQVTPEIGITATPAVDLQIGPHGTMYVVAMSKNGSTYHQRLHALDLTTLTEQFGGPVEIQASYPGSGAENAFDPKQHKERAGLLIANGFVYTSWSSHCDISPYTGWVMSYNETTLAQVNVLNLTPNGSDGAIWAAGSGPAADAAGNVYLLTGNGTFDTTLNGSGFPVNGDFGNAFVKMSTAGGMLTVADYFTMSNTTSESGADTDLGSGGIILLPLLNDAQGHPRALAVGAGKDKNIYVVDQNNLGKFSPNTNSIYQQLMSALPGGVWSSPAWFNGNLYYGGVGDTLKAFAFTSGAFGPTPASHSVNSFGYPGATPSISANGTSNGIVWAAENGATAVLHAYDATDLSKELYNSNQSANGRDHFGAGNKFIVPTVVNGKVYVGTANGVGVFGLLPALSISKTHTGNFTQRQQNATYTVTVSNANGAGATNGTVTVTEVAPAGESLVSMSGTGWTCGSTTCTRGDALAGGSSYPAITVTVNVAPTATSPQVNQVSVSGGGSATANASDSTVINVGIITPVKTGVFRNNGFWILDVNGDGVVNYSNLGVDRVFQYTATAGDIPLVGDWNGDGRTKTGIFRNGLWILDANGNGILDNVNQPGGDLVFQYTGTAGDIPVVGDWNGDGRTKTGVFRNNGFWILDVNGDGVVNYSNLGVDRVFQYTATAGDIPLVGDWNGDGRAKTGVFRNNGTWILDVNGDGVVNYSNLGVDMVFQYTATAGDVPVVGDWNGDGRTKTGIFRNNGFWILDVNGDGVVNYSNLGVDRVFQYTATPGDIPVLGDWNGDFRTKTGIFRNGLWILDVNGDGLVNYSNLGVDRVFQYTATSGDKPLVGRW